MFAEYPTKYMCTNLCPCPISDSTNGNWVNLWLDNINGLPLERFSLSNNTFRDKALASSRFPNGLVLGSRDKVFDNFWDCY